MHPNCGLAKKRETIREGAVNTCLMLGSGTALALAAQGQTPDAQLDRTHLPILVSCRSAHARIMPRACFCGANPMDASRATIGRMVLTKGL
jgi:hypothetical protein